MGRSESQNARYRRKKAFVRWLRANLPCSTCGETHPERPYLIEFDHRHGDKKMGISDMVSADHSMKMILNEMSHTAPLCSSCHAEVSYDGKERTSMETLSRSWLEEKWAEWKARYLQETREEVTE